MANIKISELNEKTELNINDIFPVVDMTTNETKKITGANLLKNEYSTSEIKTNTKWVDGKFIYRKTVFISALPNDDTGEYQTNITNIDRIINMYGQYQGNFMGSFTTRPLNFSISNADMYDITTYIGSGNVIKIKTNYDMSVFSGYITIEYTKTS